MPYVRRSKKMPMYRKKKRVYRKKKSLSFNKPVSKSNDITKYIPRLLHPPRIKRTLRYHAIENIQGAVGGQVAGQIIRANSIYDPKQALGGFQPRGITELFNRYGKCCVIGGKISVRFYNTGTQNRLRCGVALSNEDIVPNTFRDVEEYEYCLKGDCVEEGQNGSCRTINMRFNPNKMLGVSKPLSHAPVHHTKLTNPPKETYLWVWGYDPELSNKIKYTAHITIDYTCVFFEPENVPPA